MSNDSLHADAASSVQPAAEHHCACGALLARWVEGGLELKCRRCKRLVTVHFPDGTVTETIP